jgi:hypothetical protein
MRPVFLLLLLLLAASPLAAQRQADRDLLGLGRLPGTEAGALLRHAPGDALATSRGLAAVRGNQLVAGTEDAGAAPCPPQPGETARFRGPASDRRPTFQLGGGGINAWAPGPAVDAEIVRAMRAGVALTVETRSVRGRLVRDYYQLRGAATAMDAAAIACSRPQT